MFLTSSITTPRPLLGLLSVVISHYPLLPETIGKRIVINLLAYRYQVQYQVPALSTHVVAVVMTMDLGRG